ncbi:MAG TPA: hypothetical protein VJZ49_08865 [Syntrophales bacterium]|nr:hypothetical protein [Syntrophales bacterium]
MEEQNSSGNIENPETISSSPGSPPADDGTGGAYSLEADEKKPALTLRLAEVFREGVASARPDYYQRQDVEMPPPAKKNRQEAAGTQDRVIQGVGSAAAGVGDKVSDVLGAFVQLAKKAPPLMHKYAEAYRDGAASVKQRAGVERRQAGPAAAKAKWASADGRAILNRVFKAGESAAGFIREAVSVVKPAVEVSGVRQKIRRGEKRINSLYVDIGAEVVNAWVSGPVETERISTFIEELQKSEEEIQKLQTHLAEVAAASKEAARSPQMVKKEAPPPIAQEDIRVAAGDSGAKPEEPFDHLDQPSVDHPGEGALPQQENPPDVAPDGADLSVPTEDGASFKKDERGRANDG